MITINSGFLNCRRNCKELRILKRKKKDTNEMKKYQQVLAQAVGSTCSQLVNEKWIHGMCWNMLLEATSTSFFWTHLCTLWYPTIQPSQLLNMTAEMVTEETLEHFMLCLLSSNVLLYWQIATNIYKMLKDWQVYPWLQNVIYFPTKVLFLLYLKQLT